MQSEINIYKYINIQQFKSQNHKSYLLYLQFLVSIAQINIYIENIFELNLNQSTKTLNSFIIDRINQTQHRMIPEFRESICLNPICTAPQRIIPYNNTQSTLIGGYKHQKCQKWIIDMEDLVNNQDICYIQPNLTLDIRNKPVQSLLMMRKLKNWTVAMSNLFQSMSNNLTSKIGEYCQTKINQFESLKVLCQNTVSQINNFSNKLKQNPKLPISMHLPSFCHFSSLAKFKIYDVDKLTQLYEKLVKQIQLTANLLQSISTVENQQQIRYQESLSKINQLFESQSISINQKLQQLARTCKSQLARAKFEDKYYKIQCFICKQQVIVEQQINNPPTTIGQECQSSGLGVKQRQMIYQDLLIHVRDKHYKYICPLYATRILRSHIYEVKLKDIVKQIKSKRQYRRCNYKTIWIVDRENAGNLQIPEEDVYFSPENRSQNYWIDVVNKQNTNLAKTQYITANSTKKDAADILIGLVVYELIKETNAQIKLITKDHFGSALEQIIQSNFQGRFCTMQVNQANQHIRSTRYNG